MHMDCETQLSAGADRQRECGLGDGWLFGGGGLCMFDTEDWNGNREDGWESV